MFDFTGFILGTKVKLWLIAYISKRNCRWPFIP